jgi:Family of unknown function (DUF6399)
MEHLSLWHHGLHKLGTRKLKVLTTLHNYYIRGADDTTAAERFFELTPNKNFSTTFADNIQRKTIFRIAKKVGEEGFVPIQASAKLEIKFGSILKTCSIAYKFKFLNNLERIACVFIESDNYDGLCSTK